MKKYEYDKKRYVWKVTLTGVIGGIVALVSLINILNKSNEVLWIAGFIVGTYTFWETFVSLSNPSQVKVNENTLVFSAYGREHVYEISELSAFKIKEFVMAKKMFIRINHAGFLKGRYWVNCYYFNDRDELLDYFRALEEKVEPDSLHVKIRQARKIEKRKGDK